MTRAEWRLLAATLRERRMAPDLSEHGTALMTALALVALDMSEKLPKPSDDEVCDECGAAWIDNHGGKIRQHAETCSQN